MFRWSTDARRLLQNQRGLYGSILEANSFVGFFYRLVSRQRSRIVIVKRASISPLNFDGLRIFDYTADQSLRASVALIEVEPGVRHKKAWSRRSDKYYLVLVGEITFVLDDVEHSLAAGDFCIVKQGHQFSYVNLSSEPATLALVHAPSFDLNQEVFVEPEGTADDAAR